jgi:hypothetical protein
MIRMTLLVTALVAAAPAAAQTVTADPASLVAAVQKAGYPAELGKDPTGDPMITSSVPGTKFVVLFYNCTNHLDCTTIQFQTAWAMTVKPQLAMANEWNRKHRFARAYIDDVGDPGLQMDVNLDKGGMSPALFRDNLAVWTAILDAFKKQFSIR